MSAKRPATFSVDEKTLEPTEDNNERPPTEGSADRVYLFSHAASSRSRKMRLSHNPPSLRSKKRSSSSKDCSKETVWGSSITTPTLALSSAHRRMPPQSTSTQPISSLATARRRLPRPPHSSAPPLNPQVQATGEVCSDSAKQLTCRQCVLGRTKRGTANNCRRGRKW